MIEKLKNLGWKQFGGLVLIVIIIIAFGFGGFGGGFSTNNQNNIAKINKTNVTTQDFMDYVNQSGISADAIRNNLDKNVLARELELIAQEKPMELILPCLFSELKSDALKNILEKINNIKFLQHIIIGLDRANKEEFEYAKKYFSILAVSRINTTLYTTISLKCLMLTSSTI